MDHRLKHKSKTIKLLLIGENLWNPGLSKEILDLTQKARSIKGKIDILDFIKITNLCFVKGPNKRIKDKLESRRKYLETTYPAKN